jgi:hypothetical protein
LALLLCQLGMGNLKTFLLGMGVAYGIYYLTRKDENGRSMLDEMLEHPEKFVAQAKNYATGETLKVIKNQLS